MYQDIGGMEPWKAQAPQTVVHSERKNGGATCSEEMVCSGGQVTDVLALYDVMNVIEIPGSIESVPVKNGT